jgi:ribonuclease T2
LAGAILCLAVALGLLLPLEAARAADQSAWPAGDFDLYILSLSWSPAFCAEHGDDQVQCAADRHFGLVVHGLWPQFSTPRRDPVTGQLSGWPANCKVQRLGAPPSQATTTWPSNKLFRHEWMTHGSCTGLTPENYVDLTSKLRQRFQVPSSLQPTTADGATGLDQLKADILRANPDLPAAAVDLVCRKDHLTEIRLCLDRDQGHGYVACPATLSTGSSCASTVTINGLNH